MVEKLKGWEIIEKAFENTVSFDEQTSFKWQGLQNALVLLILLGIGNGKERCELEGRDRAVIVLSQRRRTSKFQLSKLRLNESNAM